MTKFFGPFYTANSSFVTKDLAKDDLAENDLAEDDLTEDDLAENNWADWMVGTIDKEV